MSSSQGFRDLKVYQMAFDLAMEIFEESKKFPIEEKYSLTDQIRRASRSVLRTLPRAIERSSIRKCSSAKWLMQMARRLRRRSG